jgi:KEOPS complex subunit Cgi121
MLLITGFRNIRITDVNKFMASIREACEVFEDVDVQFFDADLVATWRHLYFAALNAVMAFETKRNISKSLAVETLLYASGKRQIKKALEIIGVKAGCTNIAGIIIGKKEQVVTAAFLVLSNEFGVSSDESVLEISKNKILKIRQSFDISTKELKATSLKSNPESALVDLVVERVALLSTKI